jgi:hypothetical protein
MLAGIEAYRREVALAVRADRRRFDQIRGVDSDVSVFTGLGSTAIGVASTEHRRLACEARAELWRHIRSGDVINAEEGDESEPTEAVQAFEEWSHTE